MNPTPQQREGKKRKTPNKHIFTKNNTCISQQATSGEAHDKEKEEKHLEKLPKNTLQPSIIKSFLFFFPVLRKHSLHEHKKKERHRMKHKNNKPIRSNADSQPKIKNKCPNRTSAIFLELSTRVAVPCNSRAIWTEKQLAQTKGQKPSPLEQLDRRMVL